MNNYEKKLNKLKNENSQLNYEYEISYQVFWQRDNSYKELEMYRLSILDMIGKNNYEIVKLENSLEKQQNIFNLLYKCYYYVDKSIY